MKTTATRKTTAAKKVAINRRRRRRLLDRAAAQLRLAEEILSALDYRLAAADKGEAADALDEYMEAVLGWEGWPGDSD